MHAPTHQPVLLQEVLNALNIHPDGVYIDATFGRGGHARAILDRLGTQGKLICLDQDPEAIAAAHDIQSDGRCTVHHGNFGQLSTFIPPQYIGHIRGILLDLGVCSTQIDQAERGFSFQKDGPLDMRMDTTQPMDAGTWLHHATESEIAQVIFTYGQDRYANRIAKAICTHRQTQPITTTKQLAQLIGNTVPNREKKHPATRTFQAIRMCINDELHALSACLEQTLTLLSQHGRLAVIAFHSLEDQVVKRFLKLRYPDQFRCLGSPIKPSADEIQQNIRARSAVFRAAEKL